MTQVSLSITTQSNMVPCRYSSISVALIMKSLVGSWPLFCDNQASRILLLSKSHSPQPMSQCEVHSATEPGSALKKRFIPRPAFKQCDSRDSSTVMSTSIKIPLQVAGGSVSFSPDSSGLDGVTERRCLSKSKDARLEVLCPRQTCLG